jgi:hypothetical protein
MNAELRYIFRRYMESGNLADGLAIAQATEVSGQSEMIDALGEWEP